MSGRGDMTGRATIRASDRDRDFVAERLREAAGDGRLDIDELEERLERAYGAKTYAELDVLLVDLPPVVAQAPTAESLVLAAPLSDRSMLGHWIVPPRIVARAGAGNIKIDFSQAICHHRHVFVQANAWAGDVTLLVPAGWQVDLSAVTSSLGSVKNRVTEPPIAGAPVVVVQGHAAMGDIVARHPRKSKFLPR